MKEIYLFKKFRNVVWCTIFLVMCCVFNVYAQKGTQPAANLDQIRNGAADSPNDPGEWVNGNAGKQNAHYVEKYSIGYRVIMSNLPTDGTPITIELGYDVSHSSKVAIDWLTDVNNINNPPHYSVFGHDPEYFDPTYETTFTPLVEGDSALIPEPPGLTTVIGTGVVENAEDAFIGMDESLKYMRIWNGDIDTIYYGPSADFTVAQSEQTIFVTFKANQPYVVTLQAVITGDTMLAEFRYQLEVSVVHLTTCD